MSAAELLVGTITGTSIDGLDVALVEFAAASTPPIPPRLIRGATFGFPEELAAGLRQLARTPQVPVDLYGRIDTWLGQFIADSTLALLAGADVAPAAVRAIGSHGQTIRHAPVGTWPYTLQIGNPAVICERTGITTVADFRRRDLAAGGQAAPLVPAFHAELFGHLGACAVLNIGGIANLTVLNGPQVLGGFDTGPGNTLLDAWAALHDQGHCDLDGRFAMAGTVDRKLLARLLSEPWLALPPPRSTGPELFNLQWLQAQLPATIAAADVQATLAELTVATIADAFATWAPAADQLLVHGGGRHNPVLMRGLQARLNIPVQPVEACGGDGDQLEAMTFAWLARQTLNGLPGNVPAVTGAAGERILGAIYPA